jgi:hypothetical protein
MGFITLRTRGILPLGLAAALVLLSACRGDPDRGARVYRQKAGNLTVSLTVAPEPPRLGRNSFRVKITDQQGAVITDAQVQLTLSMPGMPEMEAIHADGGLTEDEEYAATAEFTMRGRWQIEVRISRAGQPTESGIFSIEVT